MFDLLRIRERLSCDATSDTVSMNFRGMQVRSAEDVKRIVAAVDAPLAALGRRVNSVVNCDGFKVDDEVAATCMDAVKCVQDRYCLEVARSTSNAFLRLKLGADLAARALDHRVHANAAEAAAKR